VIDKTDPGGPSAQCFAAKCTGTSKKIQHTTIYNPGSDYIE